MNEIQWPDRGEAVSALYPRAVRGFPVGTHTNPHMYNTYIGNWAHSSAQTDKLGTDTNTDSVASSCCPGWLIRKKVHQCEIYICIHLNICTMCIPPAAGFRQYLPPGSQSPQFVAPGRTNPRGPQPHSSCWYRHVVHRNTYTLACTHRGHWQLARTPLVPLVASSCHGLTLRDMNTPDSQATSPASLAHYLLMLAHSFTHLYSLQLLAPQTYRPLTLDPTPVVGT